MSSFLKNEVSDLNVPVYVFFKKKLDKFRLSNLIEIFLYVLDSLAKDNGSNSTEYPVPTEENYQNYLSTPPPSPPSNKNEVHPKLIAVDEPNNDL